MKGERKSEKPRGSKTSGGSKSLPYRRFLRGVGGENTRKKEENTCPPEKRG